VIEGHREDLALITNLPLREPPMTAVGQDRLPEIPLLAPSAGLIVEFLRPTGDGHCTGVLKIGRSTVRPRPWPLSLTSGNAC
jgi:hypothetical protein